MRPERCCMQQVALHRSRQSSRPRSRKQHQSTTGRFASSQPTKSPGVNGNRFRQLQGGREHSAGQAPTRHSFQPRPQDHLCGAERIANRRTRCRREHPSAARQERGWNRCLRRRPEQAPPYHSRGLRSGKLRCQQRWQATLHFERRRIGSQCRRHRLGQRDQGS